LRGILPPTRSRITIKRSVERCYLRIVPAALSLQLDSDPVVTAMSGAHTRNGANASQ